MTYTFSSGGYIDFTSNDTTYIIGSGVFVGGGVTYTFNTDNSAILADVPKEDDDEEFTFRGAL